jgi:ABC-type glycerol-3-phosphate transport system substrate-binding protein
MTLQIHLRPSLYPFWLALLIAALLSGCNGRATPTPPVEPPPTETPAAQPVASEPAVPATNDQLVVWLPAFTGIASEGSAGSLLTNVFHQFEQNNPSIRLDIQVKADAGTAGLFNFLRSAQQVAPSILPDLVLINTQQLWQIVDLGMVVALEEEELSGNANFFRVANDSVRYRTQIVGIPYTVDITHLAYDGDAIESPPASWAELTAGDETYLFPAAEGGTTTAALLHYVAAGGTLLEDGSITSPEALENYFNFLVEMRANDMIPATVLDMPGYNAVWRAFAENRADLALVQVLQFYPNATGIKPPSYAPTPTLNGEPHAIADTWAFAILTEDAQRRRLALALIQELLAPEVQGPWSQSVARLPSQPASLALWTQATSYRDFVQAMLDEAVSPPNGAAFADFARRLHTAQAALIRGDLTVEAAIASMVVVE